MSPVEQTSTSPAETPSASADCASAVRCVTWKPSAPVKQFAPPEFSTIAATVPSAMTCSDQRIGFALARFDREHRGRGLRRPAVDDEGEVECRRCA